jgi:hypothetical protein
MTMKLISATTRYIKPSQSTDGDVLIKQGTLTECRPGKFGNTLMFKEADGEEVGIGAGGQLKSFYEKGKIRIGGIYNIVFRGKKQLPGNKTCNVFDISEYESQTEMFDESEYMPDEEA